MMQAPGGSTTALVVSPYDSSHPRYQRELGFAPCRDDYCDREDDIGVHAEHAVSTRCNGRMPRTCPRCLRKLAKEKKGVKCRNVRCGWSRTARRARS